MIAGLTVKQAAHAGRCSRSTIGGLVHRGRLKVASRKGGGTSPFLVLHTREEVRDIVAKLAPKSGYRAKRRAGSVPRNPFTGQPLTNPVTGRPVVSTNGASGVTVTGVNPALAALLELAKVPAEKRPLLLVIGKRFTVSDLEVLAKL